MSAVARAGAAPLAGLRFEYLADAPGHAAQLARWHHDAWGALLPGWSIEAAQAELESHCAHCAIPTTIVACEGDELAGSASLLANDHERIRAWSPWLASVFVRPESRGRGIGRALVARALEDARTLRVPVLYLYTTDAMPYYAALGWQPCGRMMLDGADITVMSIAPARTFPSPAHAGVAKTIPSPAHAGEGREGCST